MNPGTTSLFRMIQSERPITFANKNPGVLVNAVRVSAILAARERERRDFASSAR
jgi:hypothetical protein